MLFATCIGGDCTFKYRRSSQTQEVVDFLPFEAAPMVVSGVLALLRGYSSVGSHPELDHEALQYQRPSHVCPCHGTCCQALSFSIGSIAKAWRGQLSSTQDQEQRDVNNSHQLPHCPAGCCRIYPNERDTAAPSRHIQVPGRRKGFHEAVPSAPSYVSQPLACVNTMNVCLLRLAKAGRRKPKLIGMGHLVSPSVQCDEGAGAAEGDVSGSRERLAKSLALSVPKHGLRTSSQTPRRSTRA